MKLDLNTNLRLQFLEYSMALLRRERESHRIHRPGKADTAAEIFCRTAESGKIGAIAYLDELALRLRMHHVRGLSERALERRKERGIRCLSNDAIKDIPKNNTPAEISSLFVASTQ